MSSYELPFVACTCGRPIGSFWFDYQRKLEEGYSIEEALDSFSLTNLCCRLKLMTPGKVARRSYLATSYEVMAREQGIFTKRVKPTKEIYDALMSMRYPIHISYGDSPVVGEIERREQAEDTFKEETPGYVSSLGGEIVSVPTTITPTMPAPPVLPATAEVIQLPSIKPTSTQPIRVYLAR